MISRSGIHAVRALTILASLGNGGFAGASAIAAEIGAPANYLGKLLQTLTHHGIVESRKGAGGGFRLARPPSKISLLDAIGPIDPMTRWQGCFLGLTDCSEESPCAVHRDWTRLRQRYLDLLARTTIAQVLRRPPRFMSLPSKETR